MSEVDIVNTRTTLLQLDIAPQFLAVWIILVVSLLLLDLFRDERCPADIITQHGLRNMYPVDDRVILVPFIHTMGEKSIARLVLDLHHALFGVAGDLDTCNIILNDDLLDDGARVGVDVF